MCPVVRRAEVVDCPALAGFASDRWFADRDAIKAVLRDHLATQATRYWLDRLEPAGIWAAPVNDWPAFTADPAFAALAAAQQVRSPAGAGLPLTRFRTPVAGRILTNLKRIGVGKRVSDSGNPGRLRCY